MTKRPGVRESNIIPSPRLIYRNFGGRLMRKPVLTAEPYVLVGTVSKEGLVGQVSGRDINIVEAIAKHLNFSVQYFVPKEKSWGSGFKSNGHFPGMVGTIARRESDILADSVTLTSRRYAAVDYSFITHDDSACFITRAPQSVSTSSAILRPFTLEVWVYIGLFVVLMTVLIWVFESANRRIHGRGRVLGLGESFLRMAKVQTNQAIGQHVIGNGNRLLVVSFVVLSLFVTLLFSANLTSFYAYPGFGKTLDTLEELLAALKTGQIELGVEDGSSTQSMIRNSDGLLSEIWQEMQRRGAARKILSNTIGVQTVVDLDKFAFAGGRGIITFSISQIGASKFHMNQELFISPKYKAIVVQKGCPYLEQIDATLMGLFEAGLTDKWLLDEYRKINLKKINQQTSHTGKDRRVISVEGFLGPLIVLFTGCCISGLIFVGELLHDGRFNKDK